ncbi:hypothetical protein IANJMKHF_00360 [Klebsiella phage CPRSA]|nr:hypothetical protein IANJMKHF_00360 [Klebsiella phage CPRSA]
MKAFQILEGLHTGTIYLEEGNDVRIVVSKTLTMDSVIGKARVTPFAKRERSRSNISQLLKWKVDNI